MRGQQGFVSIELGEVVALLAIVMVIGWGIGHGIEWLWAMVKPLIHTATG